MFSAFGSKRSKHHYLCFGYISHLLMKSLRPFAKISILYSISKFFSMVAHRTEFQVAHQGSASDTVPGAHQSSASEFRSYPKLLTLIIEMHGGQQTGYHRISGISSHLLRARGSNIKVLIISMLPSTAIYNPPPDYIFLKSLGES
mgnify:CR=1 FL=1